MKQTARIALVLIVIAAEATVAAAQSGATGGAGDSGRLICRRMPETGSLVRARRQCFTKAEWDRIAETARRGAEKTVMGLMESSQSN